MDEKISLTPHTLGELRGLLAAVAGCEFVGIAGGMATARSTREWLPSLNLPSYQPPGWVFGPVWTVLYAVMGTSLSGVLRSRPAGDAQRRRALRLFSIQLACNGLWSLLFFGRRSPRAGLVDAVLLEVALLATIRAIWRVSHPAALILLPYLAWSTFALVLTADITRRNPRPVR